MDVFSDLHITSPVTSTVMSSSDLVATVESALQFDGPGSADFGMDFFDYRKEGYEDSEALMYEMVPCDESVVFSNLPPYPGDGMESHSSMASPSSTSSSMASFYQPPPSPYQVTPSTFSQLNESNKKRDKRAASADEPFPAADSNSGNSSGNGGKSFVGCKVCGDKASGYHYGVTSCEGCKGFFRRSIQKQIDYKCLRDKQCQVIRLNRNRCQYCRFRKCLEVGMSKDSVRYGRVPKKSREKNEENNNQVTQSEPEKPLPKYEPLVIPKLEPLLPKPSMYDIIVSISDAYSAHCAYTEARTRGLIRKPALFNMTDQQHSRAMEGGNNSPLQKIIMWQQLATLLTPCVQQLVEFAKRIPGFQDLGQDDKLLCIKLGFFDAWLVQASRLISPAEGTITFGCGSFITRQQMEVIFDRDFVNSLFNFVHCFNELQLSDGEIGLYSAIALVTAERDGIQDHKALRQLHDQMLECLRLQVAESHPTNPHCFPTLVAKVGELRALGEKHLDHLRWFRANWNHLKIPALFAEVFDIPRQGEVCDQR